MFLPLGQKQCAISVYWFIALLVTSTFLKFTCAFKSPIPATHRVVQQPFLAARWEMKVSMPQPKATQNTCSGSGGVYFLPWGSLHTLGTVGYLCKRALEKTCDRTCVRCFRGEFKEEVLDAAGFGCQDSSISFPIFLALCPTNKNLPFSHCKPSVDL